MKILLVPHITNTDTYWLVRNILDVFSKAGHTVAISTNHSYAFANASLYAQPPVKKPLFRDPNPTSYEEWLSVNGLLSKKFLQADLTHLTKCMQEFQPDAVLALHRPAAIIAARKNKIPVFALVSETMYKYQKFPTSVFTDLNALLTKNGLEQEFSMKHLFATCTGRLTLGTGIFPVDADVTQIGQIATMPLAQPDGSVAVLFTVRQKKMVKILEQTFYGAPYPVNIYMPDTEPHTHGNLSYLAHPSLLAIHGCSVCIHDGGYYMDQYCEDLCIPQIILYDESFFRKAVGLRVLRNHLGNSIPLTDASVANIYENYRHIVVNDSYLDAIIANKKQLMLLPDSSELPAVITSRIHTLTELNQAAPG